MPQNSREPESSLASAKRRVASSRLGSSKIRKYLLSQHFLRSPRLALFLIGHSNIRKRDTVVEIGGGSGVITSALARRARRIICFEPDAETAKKLKKNLSRQGLLERVELIQDDFLNFNLEEIQEKYKVFSNPPFHLSSQILHKFLNTKNPPESFYLILQKQLALKLIPTDRHYTSQLGEKLIKQYQTKIKYPLKPTDYTPPPAVPTVLFEAKKRQLQLPEELNKTQRREPKL